MSSSTLTRRARMQAKENSHVQSTTLARAKQSAVQGRGLIRWYTKCTFLILLRAALAKNAI